MYYFRTNIFFNIAQDEIKKCTFFRKWLLYVLGCHNIQKLVKIFPNNDIVEVLKVHHFKKKSIVMQIKGPL
jgi:hypothetical protein